MPIIEGTVLRVGGIKGENKPSDKLANNRIENDLKNKRNIFKINPY